MSISTALLQKGRALLSGPRPDLEAFMKSHGYPLHDAWCGEFTASMIKAASLVPVRDAPDASNWLLWGVHVPIKYVRTGDVAVRKVSRFGGPAVPGHAGSHVGLVYSKPSSVTGRFSLLAGNQGRPVEEWPTDQFEFRCIPDVPAQP